jgi:tryptophanyl-tRNA synthetase
MAKKRVFSGIQPSGDLHIGNYLATIYKWVQEQDEKENIFCVVDQHAITVPQEPKVLKQRTLEIAKIFLAAGIDPEKSAVFVQSSRPEHSELAWILNNYTYFGELARMTQFKSKSKDSVKEMLDKWKAEAQPKSAAEKDDFSLIFDSLKIKYSDNKETYADILDLGLKGLEELISGADKHISTLDKLIEYTETSVASSNSNVGLFDYPVLMAADILLYDTDEVPVGDDQKQHVELTRDIANRLNKRYSKIFPIPEFTTNKAATRIMSLTDPTSKMSKSDESDHSRINILDTPEQIRAKLAKATTDSENEVRFDREKKPGISNLLNIMAACTATKVPELEKKYAGVSYGVFKKDVAEAVIALLEPFQARYHELSDEFVLQVLTDGAGKVAPRAQATLKRVKDAIGLGI